MRASIKYCSRSCLAHSVENIGIWSSIDIFHSVKYSILIGENNSHQYQRMIRVIWRKCGDTEFRYCAPVVPNIFGTREGLFHWGCQEEELRRASLMAPFLTGHGLDRYQPAVGGGGGDRTSDLFIYLFIYCCCSITVVPIFPLLLSPALPSPSVGPHPVVHYHGSFIHVPWLDLSPSFPIISLLPTL